MKKYPLMTAIAALALFASASSQAAWMKLQDLNGQVNFAAGSNGDPFKYSSDGINFNYPIAGHGLGASNNGANTSARSLFNSGAQTYTDHSIYFVAQGLLVAELAFDYQGSVAGLSGVQKITYNNYIAQGISRSAPGVGDVRAMVFNASNGSFSVPGDFNSHTGGLAFYNDGIVVKAADIAALSNHVPEPSSWALAGLALLGAFAARRRSV